METKINSPAAQFKGQILNRVYRVWLWRKLAPVFITEIILLTAVLFFIGRTIFVQRVIENALTVFFLNPGRIFGFIASAFANAPFAIQILGIVFLVLLAFVLRHLTQGILRLILVRENYFARVAR